MLLTRLLLLVIVLIHAACSSRKPIDQTLTAPDMQKEEAFRRFRQKFRVLSLPLQLNLTGDFSPESYPALTPATTDSLFVKSPDTPVRCLGMLPDTTNFYGIVWLAPAEVYQVVLSTFTKKGEMINERQLGVGGCGTDCGFMCSETLLIRPDNTIYSADSVASSICNEAGEILRGTTKKYVKMITGSVQVNGKIDLYEAKTVATQNQKNH